MFFILINIKIFKIRPCEILSIFFVLTKYKYDIFALSWTLKIQSYVSMLGPHHWINMLVDDGDLISTHKIKFFESNFKLKYYIFIFYVDEKHIKKFIRTKNVLVFFLYFITCQFSVSCI